MVVIHAAPLLNIFNKPFNNLSAGTTSSLATKHGNAKLLAPWDTVSILSSKVSSSLYNQDFPALTHTCSLNTQASTINSIKSAQHDTEHLTTKQTSLTHSSSTQATILLILHPTAIPASQPTPSAHTLLGRQVPSSEFSLVSCLGHWGGVV